MSFWSKAVWEMLSKHPAISASNTIFRLIADGVKDRFFGILGASAGAKSIAIGFKAGFPFRFQRQLDKALMRPIQP